ncbi:hypothetical protein SBOR_2718 [Sclerotinia borealis F-4128]|uniref:Hyaluronan/mRNA-binding protein domain-containing protein n=1 Tax=Sclerotinia borealis (strain F-4128) TaxID=1432307 RepID=W9CQP1_SCLBF|nr:hypothetical protein SBOR_2718 [Sclerotinia borealis F-4128]
MSGIASKNLYDLLGNDHEYDSDKEPEAPVKVVDKTPARNVKRNATGEAPAAKAPVADGRGARRGGFAGNEGAFRDRNAGSANNQGKPTDDSVRQDRHPRREGGAGRGRGGARGGGKFDRHSRGVGGDSEKQAAHGWGAPEGGAELADEQAGDAIAKTEAKEVVEAPAEAVAEDVEPEDNSISYTDYLAQLEEKRAALGAATPEARKPDSKLDKKWANAKAIAKEEEEDFVAGTGGKAKRERQRVSKQVLEIDQRYVEPAERGGGGARGGFRGGRGRGDGPPRGDRGGFRGRGEGGRGRARGDRGPPRQSAPRNAGTSASIQIEDKSAFPSLGA